jgi:mRNA-degrading endonuclease toxin of MazEF toxin-antitoxin module
MRRVTLRGAMVVCLTSAVMPALAHDQDKSRPQLVVQKAEANLAAGTLLIEGSGTTTVRSWSRWPGRRSSS